MAVRVIDLDPPRVVRDTSELKGFVASNSSRKNFISSRPGRHRACRSAASRTPAMEYGHPGIHEHKAGSRRVDRRFSIASKNGNSNHATKYSSPLDLFFSERCPPMIHGEPDSRGKMSGVNGRSRSSLKTEIPKKGKEK